MIDFEDISVEISESDDCNSTVSLKMKVSNPTQEPVARVRYKSLIESLDGAVIGVSFDNEMEVDIKAGGMGSFEDSVFFDRRYLVEGEQRIKARTFAQIYSVESHDIEAIPAPEESETVCWLSREIRSNFIRNDTKIAVLRTGPDEEKMYGMSMRMGIENLVSNEIEMVVYLDVCDASDESIECGDISITVPAKQVGFVNIDVYGMKKNKMKEAKLKVKLLIFREIGCDSGETELRLT